MAEGGSGRGQSVKGSDAGYNYNCSDCLGNKDEYTEAMLYCPECQRYLCEQCAACGHDMITRWGEYTSNRRPCVDKVNSALLTKDTESNSDIENVQEDLGDLHLKADTVVKDIPSQLTDREHLDQPLVGAQSSGPQSVSLNKPYRTLNKTSFNVKIKEDKSRCNIIGMCMMPSGHIILADNNNRRLKKLNSQYEVETSCFLIGKPWDICHIDADQVAVSLTGNIVQFVTVSSQTEQYDQTEQLPTDLANNMTCTRSFHTRTIHDCYSLAYSNKCLYITSGYTKNCDAVYVYDLAGTLLRVIRQDQHNNLLFSCTRRISTSRDGDRLHITTKKGLVTMDTRGNLIGRFASGELKKGAFAVCADGVGNVFVGGYMYASCNVLQVGGEADTQLSELLSHSEKIQPFALCFDVVNSRLLVSSNNNFDTVHVLQLSQYSS